MIRLLLLIYPSAWRAEYGDELAALLHARPLSFAIAIDVLWSGLRERAHQSDPAIFCGAILAVLAMCGNLLLFSVSSQWSNSVFLWFGRTQLPLSTVASAWSVYRGWHLWPSWQAGLKTGLLGGVPNFLFCIGWGFHLVNFPQWCDPKATSVPGCGITTLFAHSSIQPDSVFVLLLLSIISLLVSSAPGALLGLVLGKFARTSASRRF